MPAGNGGRAVGPANYGGRDRPVPGSKNAIGDIAGKRKAGDKDDDPPKGRGIPGVIGPKWLVRQEWQDRKRDHRETCQRLDVALVQPVNETVKFVSKCKDENDQGGRCKRKTHRSRPRKKGNARRRNSSDRAGCIASRLQLWRIGDCQHGECSGSECAGDERLGRSDKAGNGTGKAEQAECPDARNSGSFALAEQVEAPFKANECAGRKPGPDTYGVLCPGLEPGDHRFSRTACQRTWSAMKLEMK